MRMFPFQKVVNRVLLMFALLLILVGFDFKHFMTFLLDRKIIVIIFISTIISFRNLSISFADEEIVLQNILLKKISIPYEEISKVSLETQGSYRYRKTKLLINSKNPIEYDVTHFNSKKLKTNLEMIVRARAIELDTSKLRYTYGEYL